VNASLNICHFDQILRNKIYRILVCRPNHRLGNTILLTPLITELEQIYKGAEIDIVTEGDIALEVFANYLSIKNIYCLPKRGFKHPISFLSMLFNIRKAHYDLIIDPCVGSNFSRTLTKFFKGKYKLGFNNQKKCSGLTHWLPDSMAPSHMAVRPISLVRWYTSIESYKSTDFPTQDVRLTDIERTQGQSIIRELLSDSHRHRADVVIGIFANATGTKRYPSEWWGDFIATLKDAFPNFGIVEIIPMHGRSMLESEWPGYYSTSIRRMAAVMAGVDLMISADCGVMHLAVASKVPTVGMFSVTDATVYAPYGPGNRPLLTQGLLATEAAQGVVDAYSELLGSRADLFVAPRQGSSITSNPNELGAGTKHGALPC
jgi:heptosyltransferase-3